MCVYVHKYSPFKTAGPLFELRCLYPFFSQVRIGLLEHLAGEVIRVFEDSCGDEWLGQTIECCVESGDGAYRYVARADHRVLCGEWGWSLQVCG